MGLNKLFVVIGVAAFVMQPTNSASIGNSCFCTREYFPICASNGVTYSNNCEFGCAKEQKMDLDIKFYGECKEDELPQIGELDATDACVCAFIFDPVCGSDGKTYSSECEFNCAKKLNRNLETFSKGECVAVETSPVEELDECVCAFVYEPVCGSDGKTYSSECEFNCAKEHTRNLEVFTKGECAQIQTLPLEPVEKIQDEEQCMCTREYSPICGNDGTTYSNQCTFNCAKKTKKSLDIEFMGRCNEARTLAAESDMCVCTMEFAPVCGSDGRTYTSECLLGCEQRLRGGLKVEHSGEC